MVYSSITALDASGCSMQDLTHRQPLATIEPGSCLGERAVLLGQGPRYRLLAGPGGATTLALGRDAFERSGYRQRLLEAYVALVPLFQQLPPGLIAEILAAMELKGWEGGDTLIEEGSLGTELFIVVEGAAIMEGECSVNGVGEVVRVDSGCYFGEKALLCSEVWRTSICAHRGGVTTLSLSGALFRGLDLQHRLCEHVLSTVPLFQVLPDDELSQVAAAAHTGKWAAGEVVIYQGDEGEVFFVIQSGTAIVEVKLDDKPVSEAARLGPGDYFGEKALLTGERRRATVRAAQDGLVMLCLSRETFNGFGLRARIAEFWISSVPIFVRLTRAEKSSIAAALVTRMFNPGETVIAQGDIGGEFFIVQDGKAHVYVADHIGKNSHKATLEAGDFFGERALLTGDRRKATVVAGDNSLSLLVMDAEYFEQLGLKQLLAEQMLDEGMILEMAEEEEDADLDELDVDEEDVDVDEL